MLEARGLSAGYGGHPVIEGIDLTLHASEFLCLIGHNGAGKSTLLKCLFGLLASETGVMKIDGVAANGLTPRAIATKGIALVPEGRGIFPSLTVTEIFALRMHATGVPRADRGDRIDWVLGILPAIREFMDRPSATLSGGQQRIVSIGRALLSRPRILQKDEPSIGLAPKLFQDLLGPIRELRQREGLSILLVEQNVREARKMSDRAVVMKSGKLISNGDPEELKDNTKLMGLCWCPFR